MLSKSRFSRPTILLLTLSGTVLMMAVYFVSAARSKAIISECKTEMSSIITSEKAFYAEYKTFINDTKALGYTPNYLASHCQVFFSKSELPETLMILLGPESLPYVEKDSFRILMLIDASTFEAPVLITGDNKSMIKLIK